MMHSAREGIIGIRAIGEVESKSDGLKVLVIEVGINPFGTAASIAESIRRVNDSGQAESNCHVDLISLNSESDNNVSWRKLLRTLPKFQEVQIVYAGFGSFIRNVLPIVLIARFYGKKTALSYYPGESFNKGLGLIHRWTLSLCSSISVASRYLRRELTRHRIESEVKLPAVSGCFLTSRTIHSVQPNIIVVHSHEHAAGFLALFRAFGLVKQKYPRTEMTVCTGSGNHSSLSALASQYSQNGIRFLGYDDAESLRQSFSEADLYINCSSSESLPVSLVTAMAAGLPVISFDTAGPRELIEHGANGLLVRHNDHNNLADSIIELVETPELVSRISENAKSSLAAGR